MRPTVLSGHTAAVYALAPWRGGVLSGGGDGLLAHWAAPYDGDGRLVAQLEDRVFCILPLDGAEDGQIVLGTLSGDLYWVDAGARTPPRRWRLHRDGLFGLCATSEYVFAAGGGGQLSRWRRADGTFDESVAVDSVRLRSVALLPAAGLLLVGTAAGDLHLVDPESLRTVDVVERAHDNTVFDIAVDGSRCYTGGRDGAIRSWTWAEGALRQNAHAPAHAATVNALSLRPGGGLLASAGRDREARLWGIGVGPEYASGPAGASGTADASGAAGGDALVLAKALTGPRDGGHAHSVNACRWVDAQTLATASDDRTVRVWRVP